jgi:hypothetical protein
MRVINRVGRGIYKLAAAFFLIPFYTGENEQDLTRGGIKE